MRPPFAHRPTVRSASSTFAPALPYVTGSIPPAVRPPCRRERRVAFALAAAGALFIVVATLTPLPRQAEFSTTTPLWCLVCGDEGSVDLALNVLLFVPLAMGLARAGVAARHVMAVVVSLTVSVELLQLFVIPGRDASLSDLLSNSTGGAAGVWLGRHWRFILRPPPEQARRLAAGGAIAWLLLQLFTAWALAPSQPPFRWWVQWKPDLAQQPAVFTGDILAVAHGERPLPPGPLPDDGALRASIAGRAGDGSGLLRARVVTGGESYRLAPIVRVGGRRGTDVLFVAQNWRTLVVEPRTRAADLRLRTPALRLPGVFPARAGDTLTVEGGRVGGHIVARATLPGGRRMARSLALSPSWGWSLVSPRAHYGFDATVHVLTALWIGGLLAAIAYWRALAGRGWRRDVRFHLPVVVAGLAGVALLFRFPPVHWSEWAAAAAGILAGAASARSPRRSA